MEQALGLTVDIAKHPRRPCGGWAYEDEVIDGAAVGSPPRFCGVLPSILVQEEIFARLKHNLHLTIRYKRRENLHQPFRDLAFALICLKTLSRQPKGLCKE